jgi:Rieske Fe-S protein
MTEVGDLAVARFSDLKTGAPVLVEYGDDRVWLVKVSRASVRAFDAACPHARCTLGFNVAANRFDCPCHGSSFTVAGRKIKGPTPRDMVPAIVAVVNDDVVVSGFGT